MLLVFCVLSPIRCATSTQDQILYRCSNIWITCYIKPATKSYITHCWLIVNCSRRRNQYCTDSDLHLVLNHMNQFTRNKKPSESIIYKLCTHPINCASWDLTYQFLWADYEWNLPSPTHNKTGLNPILHSHLSSPIDCCVFGLLMLLSGNNRRL